MSFGMPVDVLGTLSDKLKEMLKETQEHYSTFLNSSQLYKQRNMSENEFFDKITNYLVTVSALDFLAVRVVLELKSAMDKGTSVKEVSGGASFFFPSGQFRNKRLRRYWWNCGRSRRSRT